MEPRFDAKLADVERRVLEGPGTLDPAIRQAAARGDVPDDLAAYVDKVRRHAYKVTDEDVERLRVVGYSEDQIFELTIAAAYGAARSRLDAAMEALTGGEVTPADATERTGA